MHNVALDLKAIMDSTQLLQKIVVPLKRVLSNMVLEKNVVNGKEHVLTRMIVCLAILVVSWTNSCTYLLILLKSPKELSNSDKNWKFPLLTEVML